MLGTITPQSKFSNIQNAPELILKVQLDVWSSRHVKYCYFYDAIDTLIPKVNAETIETKQRVVKLQPVSIGQHLLQQHVLHQPDARRKPPVMVVDSLASNVLHEIREATSIHCTGSLLNDVKLSSLKICCEQIGIIPEAQPKPTTSHLRLQFRIILRIKKNTLMFAGSYFIGFNGDR